MRSAGARRTFERVGLDEFAAENYARIGTEIVAPGTPLGAGLTQQAADDLGLSPGTPVGASLIDAHAGGIGAIGGRDESGEPVDVCDRLAYIMGTSACIMATTADPCFVPGVWGPYYSGMVPGFWLNEGGQSAAGAAIDHLLRSHPAHAEASRGGAQRGRRSHRVPRAPHHRARRQAPARAALLARDVHVLPEFLGNRSPYADPDYARGDRGARSRRRYRRDGAAVRRGALRACLWPCRCRSRPLPRTRSTASIIVMGGGAGRSPLVRQIMADTTGLTVALPQTQEPVLLGAAMLGAVAGGAFALDRRDHGHDVGAGPA